MGAWRRSGKDKYRVSYYLGHEAKNRSTVLVFNRDKVASIEGFCLVSIASMHGKSQDQVHIITVDRED
jgi:hypothetical protein